MWSTFRGASVTSQRLPWMTFDSVDILPAETRDVRLTADPSVTFPWNWWGSRSDRVVVFMLFGQFLSGENVDLDWNHARCINSTWVSHINRSVFRCCGGRITAPCLWLTVTAGLLLLEDATPSSSPTMLISRSAISSRSSHTSCLTPSLVPSPPAQGCVLYLDTTHYLHWELFNIFLCPAPSFDWLLPVI